MDYVWSHVTVVNVITSCLSTAVPYRLWLGLSPSGFPAKNFIVISDSSIECFMFHPIKVIMIILKILPQKCILQCSY